MSFVIGMFQGSFNYPYWGGSQTRQMYGNFEGFPLGWVGSLMTTVFFHVGVLNPKNRGKTRPPKWMFFSWNTLLFNG